MTTTIKLLAIATLLAACGDNKEIPDSRVSDGKPADAYCSDCPAAPALGAQIDRMGRPAVNTVLTKGFTADQTAAGAAKDAYNADSSPANWLTNVPEFMKNLATLDALDTGFCGNGICEVGETGSSGANPCADCATATQVGTITTACGNQVLYNEGLGGAAKADSYQALAGLLAADEIYVDTSRGQCAFYLAVEFGVATGLGNTTCGGRAPQYDVIDFSLSMLAEGIAGFSTDGMFKPDLKDNAPPHTDYLASFPYLGDPH
ncbi:MAG: DUF4331 family protein [Kofleriaceae bacterium]|nr:DUF4331 family protein [Kofleriaceae bacterium]